MVLLGILIGWFVVFSYLARNYNSQKSPFGGRMPPPAGNTNVRDWKPRDLTDEEYELRTAKHAEFRRKKALGMRLYAARTAGAEDEVEAILAEADRTSPGGNELFRDRSHA